MTSLLHSPLALEGALRFLSRNDAIHCAVYAIEYDDHAMAQFLDAQSLFPIVSDASAIVHCAGAHGCMKAVYTLRKNARRRDHGSDIKIFRYGATAKKKKRRGDSSLRRTLDPQVRWMAWVNTFRPYTFPREVMFDAARRGDLTVVKWLHTTTEYEPHIAMEFAARSGQLEIVQWLADNVKTSLDFRKRNRNLIGVVLSSFDSSSDGSDMVEFYIWVVLEVQDFRRLYSYHQFIATRRGLLQSRASSSTVYKRSPSMSDAVADIAGCGELELLKSIKRIFGDLAPQIFTANAVTNAAAMGHLDVVLWLMENGVEHINVRAVLKAAAQNAHLNVVQWLHSAKICENAQVPFKFELLRSGPRIERNVAKKHAELLKWRHENGMFRMDARVAHIFYQCGDVQLLKWFFERLRNKPTVDSHSLALACMNGSLALVQYLAEECSGWDALCLRSAVECGSLDVAKWIYSMEAPEVIARDPETEVLNAAVQQSDLDEVEWNRSSEPPKASLSDAVDIAAAHGHLEMVEWVLAKIKLEKRYSFSVGGVFEHCYEIERPDPLHVEWGCSDARKHDRSWRKPYVDLLLRYCPKECIGNQGLSLWAARFGYVEILEQVLTDGIERWRRHSLRFDLQGAVFTKPLLRLLLKNTKAGDLVQRCMQRHPEWLSVKIVRWAAKFTQLPLIEWILTHEHTIADQKLQYSAHEVISTASRYGHLAVLEWMFSKVEVCRGQRQGLTKHNPWKSAVSCAAKSGHVHVVKWLHGHALLDASMSKRAIKFAVQRGHVTVLEWFHQSLEPRNGDLFAQRELSCAMGQGHADVVQWLLSCQPALGSAEQVRSFLAAWSSAPSAGEATPSPPHASGGSSANRREPEVGDSRRKRARHAESD